MIEETDKTLAPETDKVETQEIELPAEEMSDIKTQEYSEDEVVVSKKDLEAIKRDKENLKKGILSAKKRSKEGIEEANKKVEETKSEKVEAEKSFLTKDEFYKSTEQEAIAQACKDELTEKNWSEIVKYYTPRLGKGTVKDILTDIADAKYLWERDNPMKKENKEATAKVAEEKKPAEGSKQKEKNTTIKGRKLLKKQPSVQDWYKEE